MKEKIILAMLDETSANIKRQTYIEQDGVEYTVGTPHRKEYMNNMIGRTAIKNELPKAQQNAILAVWGDAPTVEDYVEN